MLRENLGALAMPALALACALALGGCGQAPSQEPAADTATNTAPVEAPEPAPEPEKAEYDPMVSSIDLTLDGGTIRYDHFEKANAELTDSENALVFVFDFTNAQTVPAQCQSVFRIQFFQNGSELSSDSSYSSEGEDQYELVGAFFNEAMKDGTVTFGRIVVPEDDSPITVMVSPNGVALADNYQTMEVNISDASESSSASSSETSTDVSADEINAALQGTWQIEGAETGYFTFDQWSLTVDSSAASMSGTYEIDADSSSIIGHLETSDGTVKVTIPYEYDGTSLKIFNNQGAEMTRV